MDDNVKEFLYDNHYRKEGCITKRIIVSTAQYISDLPYTSKPFSTVTILQLNKITKLQ